MTSDDTILDFLRKNKLRLTKVRRAMAEIFSSTEAPLSVSDILSHLKKMHVRVNKTTVYRDLDRLERLGVIESVQLGRRKQYYEIASRGHHHHLVCLRCERVEDVGMNEQALFAEEQKVNQEKQFTIFRHSLEFFGLCGKCQMAG